MPLEPDIVAKIRAEFSAQDAETAIRTLEAARKSGRIARCAVVAAQGSLEWLADCVRLADLDYRDLIMIAEYRDQLQVRDLTASFLIDSPEKLWISPVAAILQTRGYYLQSLDTVPAKKGILHSSESGEGVATFEGDLGLLTVAKTQGQWVLKHGSGDLEVCDLSKPFTDESKFCDALSSYILGQRVGRTSHE